MYLVRAGKLIQPGNDGLEFRSNSCIEIAKVYLSRAKRNLKGKLARGVKSGISLSEILQVVAGFSTELFVCRLVEYRGLQK
jgi:hypothetical protein